MEEPIVEKQLVINENLRNIVHNILSSQVTGVPFAQMNQILFELQELKEIEIVNKSDNLKKIK